jgi:hypothetical protein
MAATTCAGVRPAGGGGFEVGGVDATTGGEPECSCEGVPAADLWAELDAPLPQPVTPNARTTVAATVAGARTEPMISTFRP